MVNAHESDGIVCLADVQPEPIHWLWQGYIPAGKLTLIDGDPGDGKSTLTLDLAARITTGREMPDGSPGRSGDVLVMSAEDGIADTIRPRFDAAHGDPFRVRVLHEVREGGHPARPFELPTDLDRIRREIVSRRAVLLTIDPLMAFLGGVDSHNDQSVRRALHPLSKMAEDTGCAIVVVRHLNKGSGSKALYRGGGSIGIGGAARAVHLVALDPDDESRRLLAPVKINVAVKPETMAYRLVSVSVAGSDCARVQWEGTTSHRADDLVNMPDEDERSARVSAVEFLQSALACGPRLSREVEEEAQQAHSIAPRTLKRARQQLAVVAERRGGEWWMRLSEPKSARGPLPETGTVALLGGPVRPLPCQSCGGMTEFFDEENQPRHPACVEHAVLSTVVSLPAPSPNTTPEPGMGEPEADLACVKCGQPAVSMNQFGQPWHKKCPAATIRHLTPA